MLEKINFAQQVIYIKDNIPRVADREYKRAARRFDFDRDLLETKYKSAQTFVEAWFFHLKNSDVFEILVDDDKQIKKILTGSN